MIKKRYILGIVLVLFMLIAVATAVDDVSAAKYKKFDSGKKVSSNGYTSKWVAYSNGKDVKCTGNFYMKIEGQSLKIGTMKVTLVKVSKNKIKGTMTSKFIGSKKESDTKTFKSKLSTKTYYKKNIKKLFKSF